MDRLLRLAMFVGKALTVAGLLAQIPMAKAITRLDHECITLLNPASCRSAGNSVCNYLAGKPGGSCGGKCTFCDSSQTIPAKACIALEGSTCYGDEPSVSCGTSNKKKGDCRLNTSCLCLNISTAGPCDDSDISLCTN